jgi:hypothetical protein
MKKYIVWRRRNNQAKWTKTGHDVKALTQSEADTKMRRMLQNLGEVAQLIAKPVGVDPNDK